MRSHYTCYFREILKLSLLEFKRRKMKKKEELQVRAINFRASSS